jgi:hypothetical protein
MRKKSGRKRTVVTRSGSAPRFLYTSLKSNRLIPSESELEFNSNNRHEFDPNVAYYSEHQREEVIEGTNDTFNAFPDTERFTKDGIHQVIEIKTEAKLADPKTKARLDDIRRHYAKNDVPYVVWTELELYRNDLHRQLEELKEFRKPGERRRLLALPAVNAALSQPLPDTLEDMAELLGSWQLVKRLLANDILVVDINDPFGPSWPARLH